MEAIGGKNCPQGGWEMAHASDFQPSLVLLDGERPFFRASSA